MFDSCGICWSDLSRILCQQKWVHCVVSLRGLSLFGKFFKLFSVEMMSFENEETANETVYKFLDNAKNHSFHE